MEGFTLKQFIDNPAGKGSAYLTARYAIKADLERRFITILKQYKIFKTSVYFNKKTDGYIFYVRVPSEDLDLKKELLYDVILELTPPNITNVGRSNNLLLYNLKLWSNSPGFMFSYMYVANKAGLIPRWLISSKCAKRALKDPPATRNPVEAMGFEKSLYFAIQYLFYMDYLNVANIGNLAKKFDKGKLLPHLMHPEDKLLEYNKIKKLGKKTTAIKETTGVQKMTRNSVKKLVKPLTSPLAKPLAKPLSKSNL